MKKIKGIFTTKKAKKDASPSNQNPNPSPNPQQLPNPTPKPLVEKQIPDYFMAVDKSIDDLEQTGDDFKSLTQALKLVTHFEDANIDEKLLRLKIASDELSAYQPILSDNDYTSLTSTLQTLTLHYKSKTYIRKYNALNLFEQVQRESNHHIFKPE